MSHSIQIYNGTGASHICVQAWKREIHDLVNANNYKIDEFNSSYSAGFNRDEVAMVIIPGGNAYEMRDEISVLAKTITHAVTANASFLGSCAGAIIQGYAPLQLNPFEYNILHCLPNSSSTKDAKNLMAIETFSPVNPLNYSRFYYAFGADFSVEENSFETNKECKILQFYKTGLKADKAATILYEPLGFTPRLFTGIHPEISSQDVLSKEFIQGHDVSDSEKQHIKNISLQLEDSEIIRKETCKSWFTSLGLSVI